SIVRILQDPGLREEMGREAQEQLASSDNQLLEDRWKKLLSCEPTQQSSEELDAELLRLLFDNILHLYGRGVRRKNIEISKLKKEQQNTPGRHQNAPGSKSVAAVPVGRADSRADQGGRRAKLDALLARRELHGSIGVIDFLIEIEKSRMHAGG